MCAHLLICACVFIFMYIHRISINSKQLNVRVYNRGVARNFKRVLINGRMSIKQGSVGVQFQMLTSCTHTHFEFTHYYPIGSIATCT